jgi:hypothetical protein
VPLTDDQLTWHFYDFAMDKMRRKSPELHHLFELQLLARVGERPAHLQRPPDTEQDDDAEAMDASADPADMHVATAGPAIVDWSAQSPSPVRDSDGSQYFSQAVRV